MLFRSGALGALGVLCVLVVYKMNILISEIFGPVIQGEGALIGRPTVFVRTGGCDYRCDWCDTLYAVLPQYKGEWSPMSAHRVLDVVQELSPTPILVTLSGGNPALQPLQELLGLGRERGFTFALETQGSICKNWFAKLDYLVLSPKPPSSQMTTNWDVLAQCVTSGAKNLSLKVVVFDEDDYLFAREVHTAFPSVPFYLQVGSDIAASEIEYSKQTGAKINWILSRVLADGWHDATILPQLHTLIWGQKRGV